MSRTFPAPAATPASRWRRARRADGYTILVVSTGFIVNPSMYAKCPMIRSRISHRSRWCGLAQRAVRAPVVPGQSLKELIELVKANPGKYSFAQPATGSTPHLAGELFKLHYGLDLIDGPFNSAALAINSTLAATPRLPSPRCRRP